MKVYLDNCCFNRPFDDQLQLRIRLESEAKLRIQEEIRAGNIEMLWSYVLDFENSNNPFKERQEHVNNFKRYCTDDIEEDADILQIAKTLMRKQVHRMDSLHIACSIVAKGDYFITTDDKILNKSKLVKEIRIISPIGFIIEELSK